MRQHHDAARCGCGGAVAHPGTAASPGPAVPLWERPGLRAVAGPTLRPGGFALTDRAVELAHGVPGQRALDVGSGLGATVDRLRARHGMTAFGVEPSAAQLARAGNAACLARARGDALPFADGAFDMVFCECALCLFDAPQAGLAEFHRVLAPGGRLVLSDLYSTATGTGAGPSTGAGEHSCAQRAVPLSTVRAMVEACGLAVRTVEDHTPYLRELAARLVLAGEDAGCACGLNPGYYLMIAQKEDNIDAG